MLSTRQFDLLGDGGADLSDQTMDLYRLRRQRRGARLTAYQHQWLNALTPNQRNMLEDSARLFDKSDRDVRRARRASTSSRPLARRRGAGRPRAQASRSSARSGDSGDGDDGPGEPPPPPAAPLRLAPPARAVYAFACLGAGERGADAELQITREQTLGVSR